MLTLASNVCMSPSRGCGWTYVVIFAAFDQLWTRDGGPCQQWMMDDQTQEIKLRSDGNCLDIIGWSKDNGANIYIYKINVTLLISQRTNRPWPVFNYKESCNVSLSHTHTHALHIHMHAFTLHTHTHAVIPCNSWARHRLLRSHLNIGNSWTR